MRNASTKENCTTDKVRRRRHAETTSPARRRLAQRSSDAAISTYVRTLATRPTGVRSAGARAARAGDLVA